MINDKLTAASAGVENNNNNQDRVINDLYEWLSSNGLDMASNCNLRLIRSDQPEEGRCVKALKDIEQPNELLVEIPERFVVNFRFALNDPDLYGFFEFYHQKQQQQASDKKDPPPIRFNRLDAVYFYLIMQLIDKQAPMNKFAASMPTSYDTPEYFDADLIERMPFHLKSCVDKRIGKFKLKYAKLVDLLDEFCSNESNRQQFKSISFLKDSFSYDLYKWAFCSVNSRCFHIDESDICSEEETNCANRFFGKLTANKKLIADQNDSSLNCLHRYLDERDRDEEIKNNLCCLMPFLDFMNHSLNSNAYGFYDREKKAFILRSMYQSEPKTAADSIAIKQNEQIYITYGMHDNQTLLVEYGFILDENPNDRIAFMPEDFVELLLPLESNDDEETEQIFWKNMIRENYLSDLTCNTSSGPSWFLLKTLDFIRLLRNVATSPSTSKQPKKKLRISSNQEIKPANASAIRSLFIKLLEKYESSLNDSLTKLNEKDLENKLNNLSGQASNQYHLDMVRRFCLMHLRVIKFNFDLAKDSQRWHQLF